MTTIKVDALVPKRKDCVEKGCPQKAGPDNPYWCNTHNKERIERISKSLDALSNSR